jgi:hypothetical protein
MSTAILKIEPQVKDLGEFDVRRALPSPQRRMVGPFIFFDHFGPATFSPGAGIQVRPHPHIGIATVTYLFEGQIVHRDSLGYNEVIRPGAVNLMTAGRGIVHSERAGDDIGETARLHGLQLWLALPDELEQTEPAFMHYPASTIPEFAHEQAAIRLIAGEWLGQLSPVKQHSPTLYAECRLSSGSRASFPLEHTEIAIYVVSGKIGIHGEDIAGGIMLVLNEDPSVEITAQQDSMVVFIGGDPVGERHIWWNFVASKRSMITQARENWIEGRFTMVEGDDEFIPAPD